MTIQEILKILSGIKDEQIYSCVCKVVDINKNDRTCTCLPINGDSTINEVKLQSDIGKNTGIVVFPIVGSFVIATFISRDTAFISLVVEVDEIYIDAHQIVINKGVNGGIPIAANIAQRLNALEQRMLSHQHLYISPAGPTPVPTIIDPSSNPLMPLTQSSMLENNNIKHG